jgi:hypothetical protein
MNDQQTSRRCFGIEFDPEVKILADQSQVRTVRIRLLDGPPILGEEIDSFMMRIVARVISGLDGYMIDSLFNFLGFGEQAVEIQYIDPGDSEQKIRDELIYMITVTMQADVLVA